MALEHRRESRVDRLREGQRLVRREVHAARPLGHDSGRARRERRDHLLGRGHLRERGDLERELTHLVARREVVVASSSPVARPADTSQRAVPRIGSRS